MYMEELGCYMTKKNPYKLLVPVGALLAFASLVNATTIGPGGSAGPPAPTLSFPGGSALTSMTVSGSDPADNLAATYTESVYADASNTFCAGCLDFVIQVSDTNTDVVDVVSAGSFAGFMTNVGYSSPGVSYISPASISRTGGTGAVVNFSFAGNDITDGKTSAYLIIQTNALTYGAGTVGILDQGSFQGAGFAPTPEPNMAALLSVFAIGILGIAYRRKKNAAKNTQVQG
jgi:hypothetical protein